MSRKGLPECALQILVLEETLSGPLEGRENIVSIILIVGLAQQSFREMRSNKKEY